MSDWQPLPDDEERPQGLWSREDIENTIRAINHGFDSLNRSHLGDK